tara:strand:+ start:198 stop:491 length:294 start_codon:yes stop_codon:yes gene_type:complete
MLGVESEIYVCHKRTLTNIENTNNTKNKTNQIKGQTKLLRFLHLICVCFPFYVSDTPKIYDPKKPLGVQFGFGQQDGPAGRRPLAGPRSRPGDRMAS